MKKEAWFCQAVIASASLVTFSVSMSSYSIAQSAPPGGDAVAGKQVYERRCMSCHSPSANGVGPMHSGVVGRKAGSVANFMYSDAVKAASVLWDREKLDRWLTDPEQLIPGQKMNIRVSDEKQRRDVIAYLATLK